MIDRIEKHVTLVKSLHLWHSPWTEPPLSVNPCDKDMDFTADDAKLDEVCTSCCLANTALVHAARNVTFCRSSARFWHDDANVMSPTVSSSSVTLACIKLQHLNLLAVVARFVHC